MMDGITVTENDIYLYFEAVQQLEPQRVLDIGMLLKRAGGVSRKAMNREVAEEIQLDGVDFFPENDFPVWRNIYNSIMDETAFLKQGDIVRYDCVFMLGAEMLSVKAVHAEFMSKIRGCTRYVLSDCKFDEWSGNKNGIRVIDLKVDDDAYYLYDFGE